MAIVTEYLHWSLGVWIVDSLREAFKMMLHCFESVLEVLSPNAPALCINL